MPGEKILADGVRLTLFIPYIFYDVGIKSNTVLLADTSLLAIIHLVGALTLLGYAQHYYFHFSKNLPSAMIPKDLIAHG